MSLKSKQICLTQTYNGKLVDSEGNEYIKKSNQLPRNNNEKNCGYNYYDDDDGGYGGYGGYGYGLYKPRGYGFGIVVMVLVMVIIIIIM